MTYVGILALFIFRHIKDTIFRMLTGMHMRGTKKR